MKEDTHPLGEAQMVARGYPYKVTAIEQDDDEEVSRSVYFVRATNMQDALAEVFRYTMGEPEYVTLVEVEKLDGIIIGH